jgi:glycerate 2-kinase
VTSLWPAMLRDVLGIVRSAVAPGPLVAQALRQGLELRPGIGVHLLVVGKAAGGMLSGIDPVSLPLRRACATMPPAHAVAWTPWPNLPVRAWPCDHPFATERNVEAAREVASFVASTPHDELLLVLLSGGASAHLTWPRDPLSLDELLAVSRRLMKAGASIHELNACRRAMERLKGGGLARLRPTGRTLVLVLSDVIGDPLEVIGSGPFTPDASMPDNALAVFDRFIPRGEHAAARRVLESSQRPAGEAEPCFAGVTHRVIGNNDLAIDAAVAALLFRGIPAVVAHRRREGSVASWAAVLRGGMSEPVSLPRAWVVGGEPVVDVGTAGGLGGPSQELALTLALEFEGVQGWACATLSTDGIDGPTHAAGAVVDGDTCRRVRTGGVDPTDALADHDSTRALEAAGDLVVTGPTGTNVNHVAVLVRFPAGTAPR